MKDELQGNEPANDAEEIWDEFSEIIDDNFDSMAYFVGREVVTKESFMKAIEKLNKPTT